MIFFVLSDDKICRAFVRDNPLPAQVKLIVYHTNTIARSVRLLRRRTLTLTQLTAMALAEVSRPAAPKFAADAIRSTDDLLMLAHRHSPERIILFRAGLIIGRKLLDTGIPVWNIHCASIPQYGGLGSIARALRDGALNQSATLHVVTTKIDEGDALDKESYRLDPAKSYAANEAIAYAAGCALLRRTFMACL